MSQEADRRDLETQWWEEVGASLVNALKHVRSWSQEGNPNPARYVGYLEFSARARGDLVYAGGSYTISDGFAQLLEELAPIRYLEHDLVRLIVERNTRMDVSIPTGLTELLSGPQQSLRRPREKGEHRLSRSLRKTISWWGVQRGVDLGLQPAKNQYEAQKPHANNAPCACVLVLDAFHQAGWSEVTYDIVLTAWQKHRYMGSKDDRKATIKQNATAFERRFQEIDELVKMLVQYDDELD